MKQTINGYDFIEAFKRANRSNNFSHEGLCALFEYLENMEQDTGEEMALDVIAICCDFSEYDTANEACTEMVSGWETPENKGILKFLELYYLIIFYIIKCVF